MNWDTLALISFVLALIPASLFVLNLLVYRSLPGGKSDRAGLDSKFDRVSVLIPARNEEANIHATLEAVLANRGCAFEVIVLDDDSSDRTAAIVNEWTRHDGRVRLESAPPLPAGWCGKQHACHILAGLARYPLLVFIDADVRLGPDALSRLALAMGRSEFALLSGVPCQETGTVSERLLLPLIHFVLLGFLPMHAMVRTRWPSMSAGCGQLFVARHDAYMECGGHAMIRDSLHDGLKLPRVFRRAGFVTGLFDATDLATCRMYRTNAETWCGLVKNATEGLAAPATIGPMTALLIGGQVLPFVLLRCASLLSSAGFLFALLAVGLVYVPRFIGAWRFRQSLSSALLHPLGVLALLLIQWHALVRYLLGKTSPWKGRSYAHRCNQNHQTHMRIILAILTAALLVSQASAGDTLATNAPACLELRDQFDAPQKLTFPTTKLTLLTIADRKGSEQIAAWVAPVKQRFDMLLDIRGIADVSAVPAPLRGTVRKKFRNKQAHPVMMDWSGEAVTRFGYVPGQAEILVLACDGQILQRQRGAASDRSVQELCELIERTLKKSEGASR